MWRAFAGGLAVGWMLARWGGRAATLDGPGGSRFDFLALMSHEIKTPINIITGYLELLEDGVPDPLPASAWEHVHHARLAAVRMTDLVNNLLTWTRLQRGRARAFHEETDAETVVQEACKVMGEQADARGIRLEVQVPDGLRLWTDPAKAAQALSALVANGIKFTHTGSVRVRASREGGRVRFHVRDTGIGIPPEHLETIFRPYWQVEATERRVHGGVGIGLAVARQLARLLGGDITVRSMQGDGSEFVLDLPAARP